MRIPLPPGPTELPMQSPCGSHGWSGTWFVPVPSLLAGSQCPGVFSSRQVFIKNFKALESLESPEIGNLCTASATLYFGSFARMIHACEPESSYFYNRDTNTCQM